MAGGISSRAATTATTAITTSSKTRIWRISTISAPGYDHGAAHTEVQSTRFPNLPDVGGASEANAALAGLSGNG
jgi:hypothetical protein